MISKNVIVDLMRLVSCRHFPSILSVLFMPATICWHFIGTRIPVHDLLDSVGCIWLISANIDAQSDLDADER